MGPRAPPGGVGSRRPTCQAWWWCPSGRLVKLGRGEGGPTSRGPFGTRREKRDGSETPETRVALGLSHVRTLTAPAGNRALAASGPNQRLGP